MKHFAILGAGITGLTLGRELSRLGHHVTVLEKEGYIGGLCATFSKQGFLFDLGPHNFHTNNNIVKKYIFDDLGVTMQAKPYTTSKIHFRDQIVDYPIRGMKAITVLPFEERLACIGNFLLARLKLRLRKPKENSFEDWVIHRFGKPVYDLYFGPYAKKVWGMNPNNIDKMVAIKRVPATSITQMAKKALFKNRLQAQHSEDLETTPSYYPEKGIGAVCDTLASDIKKLGGHILCNTHIEPGGITPGSPTQIHATIQGNKHQVEADYLINTVNLSDFTSLIQGKLAVEPTLHYRSIVFLYLVVNRETIFNTVPWLYFNDPEDSSLLFNRAYCPNSFCPSMRSGSRSLLCLEVTCNYNDEIWNYNSKELTQRCIASLEKRKLLSSNDCVDAFIEKRRTVYPVFELGFDNRVKDMLCQLKQHQTIGSFGRQGLFCYINMDQCIEMGLVTSKKIHAALCDSRDPNFYDIMHEIYNIYS